MASILKNQSLIASAQADDSDWLRPGLHFTAPCNWINDPNGLVVLDGKIHLFYQVNPDSADWGNISWGHAVGQDYIRWEVLDVAIPDTPELASFSGSAVYDSNNTSGLGSTDEPPLVALYTGARHDNYIDQNQNLAFSLDRGTTWTKYAGNPVLPRERFDVRDPKVFWHDASDCWVMTLVFADAFEVAIYTSPNLIDWTFESVFGPAGECAGEWECSDLFELPVQGQEQSRWVMVVSVAEGAPAGGSGVQYFIGDFDGARFIESPDSPKGGSNWLDFGPDFYAAQSWSNIPSQQRRLVLSAWMSNRDYATKTPTGTWRGCHTLPRELFLVDTGEAIRASQRPVQELQTYRSNEFRVTNHGLQGELGLSEHTVRGNQYELKLCLRPQSATSFSIKVCANAEYQTLVMLDFAADTITVDRQQSGEVFAPGFNSSFSARLSPNNERYELRVIVDNSTLEVFADDGLVCLSSLLFPPAGADEVSICSDSGVTQVEELVLWSLG